MRSPVYTWARKGKSSEHHVDLGEIQWVNVWDSKTPRSDDEPTVFVLFRGRERQYALGFDSIAQRQAFVDAWIAHHGRAS